LGQDRNVITGYNTDIKHDERVFHVQTEDKGVANPTIESLIYSGGKIIASRQYSYASLLRGGYSEKAIQELLDSQHRKMLRDIRGGKYDLAGPPSFGAGIITARSFDEVVLEFLRSQEGKESIELTLKETAPPRAGNLALFELAVRGEVRSAPVAGAAIVIRAGLPGGHQVKLFEGATDESGMLHAGVQIPRDLAGARIVIEASCPLGQDEILLEVQP